MALIERFTAGGNLYADGASTFVVLVDLFRRMAETRDLRDGEIRTFAENTASQKAATARYEAINAASRDADSKAENARATAVSTAAADAGSKAESARVQATAEAKAYTDVSFAATAAGGATDAAVDAAVDRAILAQRIGSATLTQVAPGVYELTTV